MLTSLKFICQDEEYSIKKSLKKSKKNNFVSNTRSMLVTKSKKYKPTLSTSSNISLHSSFNISEYEDYNYQRLYMLNLCILRHNYDNFIALINPDVYKLVKKPSWKIYTDDRFLNPRGYSLYIEDDGKFIYLGEKTPTKFIKLYKKLEKRMERFILIRCCAKGHANIIIIDTDSKLGYYFEPHGIKLVLLNEKKQKELSKLFTELRYKLYYPKDYYFTLSKSKFENDGFQDMDISDSVISKKAGKLDAGGYCFYWCLYFVNMILKHEHLPIPYIYKQLFITLLFQKIKKTKKSDFYRHISTYSQRLEKTTKLKYPEFNNVITDFDQKVNMYLEYYKVFNYYY